jgi:hypothetical protein
VRAEPLLAAQGAEPAGTLVSIDRLHVILAREGNHRGGHSQTTSGGFPNSPMSMRMSDTTTACGPVIA